MPFEKGKSGNPSGKKKGTLSKKTLARLKRSKNLKDVLQTFFDNHLEDMLEELAHHDIKKDKGGHWKYETVCKLLSFCLPTMKASESKIQIDKMSDDEIDQVFMKVIEGADNGLRKVVN